MKRERQMPMQMPIFLFCFKEITKDTFPQNSKNRIRHEGCYKKWLGFFPWLLRLSDRKLPFAFFFITWNKTCVAPVMCFLSTAPYYELSQVGMRSEKKSHIIDKQSYLLQKENGGNGTILTFLTIAQELIVTFV